jgi:hypothetical protein
MIFEGLVRRIQTIGGGNAQPSLDEFGGSVVSKLLPDYARLCAAGKVFAVDMSAGTAKAPVTAYPTTSPEWGLYNSSTKESLVPLHVAATLISGTAGLGLSIAMATAIGDQTLVSADYAGTIKTCLDGSQRKPDAFLANNPTLVGGTPAWVALEGTKVNSVATNSVADSLVADPKGMFVARPKGAIGIEVVGETGTSALFAVQVIFAMLELDLY